MKYIKNGTGASPGIAIGKAFLYNAENYCILRHSISDEMIEGEIKKFRNAVDKAKKELLETKDKVAREIGKEHADIFLAHINILEDPILIKETIQSVRENKWNIEYALSKSIDKLTNMILSVNDTILRERSNDIKDVGRRVLKNLIGKEREALSNIKDEVIVVAYDLSPSDTVNIKKDRVKAFITEAGGETSHTAIMARALEIPAIVGVKNITKSIFDNELLIVDGNKGVIVVDPEEDTVKNFIIQQKNILKKEKKLEKLKDISAITTDNTKVQLLANIEIPEEVHLVKKHGADGIGLFRTEFLYLNRQVLPSEEEQYNYYKKVLKEMYPKSVTIRTFDIGGDKFLSNISVKKSFGEFLGLRAIRLCLTKPELFKTQLRALLRASIYGNLKIMFPMISMIEEIKAVKDIILEVKKELRRAGYKYSNSIKLGAMIEVPSAAMNIDSICKKVDFVSIGTNDLFQYLFAIDRVNQEVSYLYDPLQPVMLKVVKQVIDTCNNMGKEVSLCGEMAGDPKLTFVLLGLGLVNFSMAPLTIPVIKKIIRKTSLKEAKIFSEELMKSMTSRDIRRLLRKRK